MDSDLTQDGMEKMQHEIQVGLKIKKKKILYLIPSIQPLWTRPLPNEDVGQNLQARASLNRLRMGMVTRIQKKDMGLGRVYTKAKRQTRGWYKVLLGLGSGFRWS